MPDETDIPGDAPALTGARVLVVEDDALVGLELMTALQTAGLTVVGPVASLPEALAIVEGQPPDAAVVDLDLGDGGGAGAGTALLEAGVPFAVLGGEDPPGLEPALSGVPRLAKPVDSEELLRVVRQLLGTRPGAPAA